MLYVKILNLITKIENNDILSKNDLYVNIHYNGIKKSTTIKYNNNELPLWDEEFIFPINHNIRDFTIELKDKNSMLTDKIVFIKIIDLNYGDIREIIVDNKLRIHYGDIFYHKNYEINSLQNKVYDLGKVINKLEENNNVLAEKIETIKKIAN